MCVQLRFAAPENEIGWKRFWDLPGKIYSNFKVPPMHTVPFWEKGEQMRHDYEYRTGVEACIKIGVVVA